MRRHRLTELYAWLIAALLVFGVTAAGVVVSVQINRGSCERKAEAMRTVSRYHWRDGCLVRLGDGRYVPLANVRVTEEGRLR